MANEQTQGRAYPDGLAEHHVRRVRRWDNHASIASLVLLTALLGTATTGLLGGRPSPTYSVTAPAAVLTVHMPKTLRNGMFFETEIGVTPRRPIEELVIAVDRGLWRDFTVNTMIPAAADETFADGRFRFSYGPGEPGKAVLVKIDSQINPALIGGTGGSVAVYDGDTLLAELPVSIRVRP